MKRCGSLQENSRRATAHSSAVSCWASTRISNPSRLEPRTDGYYKKRPCPEMVYCAADILEEYLSKED